ncbi:MAG TPA: hypothetical protein VMU64_06990 [Acidimicrobiales bacterium]|nr:hypothetical protein [Acidimicrobiales bacterium]
MSNGRRYRRRITSGSTVFVLPEIPEDSPPEVREGLARRALVATTGKCPCGAELVIPHDLEPGTVTTITIEHEPGCPAVLADA